MTSGRQTRVRTRDGDTIAKRRQARWDPCVFYVTSHKARPPHMSQGPTPTHRLGAEAHVADAEIAVAKGDTRLFVVALELDSTGFFLNVYQLDDIDGRTVFE